MNKFKKYLWAEIGIEFKACLYFYAFLFYVCVCRISSGVYSVPILHMAEMILATYIMGYVQVFLLDNFDEAEKLSVRNIVYMVLCTAIYELLDFVFSWNGHFVWWHIGFAVYVLACYISVFFVYKLKRSLDTEKLNKDLESFKKGLE